MDSRTPPDLRTVMERLNLASIDLAVDAESVAESIQAESEADGSVGNFSVSLFSDDEFSSPGQTDGVHTSTVAGEKLHLLTKRSLEDKIQQLDHDKCLLEIEVERERARYKQDMVSMRNEMQLQIQKLRKRQQEFEEEVPLLRNRLKVEMDKFSDLRCSAELYHQLKSIPRDKLSVKEYILMNTYELTSSTRAQVESLRIELASIKAELAASKRNEQEIVATRDDVQKAHEREIKRLQDQHVAAEAEIQSLRSTCEEYRQSMDTFREKGNRYDLLQSKCDQLEQSNGQLQAQLQHAIESGKLATQERNKLSEELQSTVQRIDLVTLDKAYLERELQQARKSLDQLEKASERNADTVRELQESKAMLQEQLATESSKGRMTYEQRLDAQAETLQQRHERELAQLKELHSHVLDREVRHLREKNESFESQVQLLTDKLADLSRDSDELKLLLATSDAKHQNELLQITNSLKMKTLDLAKASLSIEERNKELEQVRLENTMLTNKLHVLREDFHALEQRSARELGEKSQELVRARANQSGLANLDAELKAIELVTAPQNGVEGLNATESNKSHHQLLLKRVTGLVNDLQMSKQREENKKDEIKSLERTIANLKRRIEDIGQPQSVILQSMKKRDEQLEERSAELSRLADEYRILKSELNESNDINAQLRSDLENILSHRKELEELVREQQMVVQQQQRELDRAKRQLEVQQVNGYGSLNQSFDLVVPPTLKDSFSQNNPATDVPVADLQYRSRRSKDSEDSTEESELDEVPESREPSTLVDNPHEGVVFVWQKEDSQGLPLPSWYRRLRLPEHTSK